MKGLLIKKKWIDLILSGKKKLEVRSQYTKVRGKIALIETGTHRFRGYVNIEDCIKIDLKKWKSYKHCVDDPFYKDKKGNYKTHYGYVLSGLRPCSEKIKIYHKYKPGSVVWVNFEPDFSKV